MLDFVCRIKQGFWLFDIGSRNVSLLIKALILLLDSGRQSLFFAVKHALL
jgi:hypothetical protein